MSRGKAVRVILCAVLLCVCQGCAAVESREILKYYDIEDIALPAGEKSVDAMAFLPNGNLVCALSLSKIYIYNPSNKQWHLFAEGLHTPLGISVVSDNEIIVAQRPEITRLIDHNNDGRADQFETVSDDFGMSGTYGEWVFGPVKDDKDNLFFSLGSGSQYGSFLSNEVRGEFKLAGHQGRMNSSVPYRGWIMKISPDGKVTPFAKGMREPNAPGFDSQGRLLVPDNQGDWVGATQIYHVEQDGFYGWVPALAWQSGIKKPPQTIPINELFRMRTPPAVTIPYGDMSNSATQPLADSTGGKFGPFSQQVFIGEMNHSRIMRLMLEQVGGQLQGAVIDFFEDQDLGFGTNRLAFDKAGQLWVGQTFHEGWVGSSGLKRISWKGVVPPEVKNINLTDKGFKLSFTKALNRNTALNPKSYDIGSYYYNYQPKYGSKKYDQKNVKVISASLSKDNKEVTLELGTLTPWRLYDIRLSAIKDVEGNPIVNKRIVYTLNHLTTGDTPPQPLPLVTSQPNMKHPKVPPGLKSIGGPQGVSEVIPTLSIDQSDNQGIDIRENGELVLHYNKAAVTRADGKYKRAHYIHPLYGFNGTRLTDDLPEDHPHHRGVFWAWPQLWIGPQKIENPWEQKGLEWIVTQTSTSSTEDTATIVSDVLWRTTKHVDDLGKPIDVISEKSFITVHKATADYRIIDIEIALTALKENIKIGGAENRRGYGGFTVRMPLPSDLSISDVKGKAKLSPKAPSEPKPWLNYFGSFADEQKSSIAILTHESSPGYPYGWTIRTSKSSQNPVYPGNRLVALKKNKPLTLRYRLLIQKDKLTGEQIHTIYKDFQREKRRNGVD
jgi:Family of unknown function (DUF6807)